jgi:phosphoribosylamine---glycine ligase
MNVLVVGSGGREHALAWKIAQSRNLQKLYCIPGNPGIAAVAECVPIKPADLQAIRAFVVEKKIDLTVVGPEQPLADGLVDLFEESGLTVFGPTRRAAELEWSKAFAKEFMQRHRIPTAGYKTFGARQKSAAREYLESVPLPVVLKADGLAAGKGVVICETRDAAFSALDAMVSEKAFGAAGEIVVVEEFLRGVEASVFAVCDGKDFVTLAPAQDHKRVFDNDQGKNTGGMGAYAPAPMVTQDVLRLVEKTVIRPTLAGMAAEGRPYNGCLYVGLMLTDDGPKVVEYNCRFGDPETQVVLPLYDGDLLELLFAAARGEITGLHLDAGRSSSGTAVCIVLASGGYPDAYTSGKVITGIPEAESLQGVVVFHAGTRQESGALLTAGGRVLGVTAVNRESDLRQTIDRAYAAAARVTFDGVHYRRDIGAKGLSSKSGVHSSR